MNRYDEMRNRHQQEVNAFPIGWAFSDQQFENMMRNFGLAPTDTDKIMSIGGGGCIRKTDEKAFLEMLDRHDREMQAAMDADQDGSGFLYEMFKSELANHEYGYTYDYSDALAACYLDLSDLEKNPHYKKALLKACAEYD